MVIQTRTDGIHVTGLDGRKKLFKIARRVIARKSKGGEQAAER
jgi:hypothetical protein